MVEQDYINVTDLTKIRNALAILKGIVPENSLVIEDSLHTAVIRQLVHWENELSELYEIQDDFPQTSRTPSE